MTDGSSNTALLSERVIQTADSAEAIGNGDPRLKSYHVEGTAEGEFETLGGLVTQIAAESAEDHFHDAESAYIGRSWASGWTLAAPMYMHVETPNGLLAHYENSAEEGDHVVTANSNHPGGANVAYVDGSVHFVSDNVSQEAWWALGSRNDGRVEETPN